MPIHMARTTLCQFDPKKKEQQSLAIGTASTCGHYHACPDSNQSNYFSTLVHVKQIFVSKIQSSPYKYWPPLALPLQRQSGLVVKSSGDACYGRMRISYLIGIRSFSKFCVNMNVSCTVLLFYVTYLLWDPNDLHSHQKVTFLT